MPRLSLLGLALTALLMSTHMIHAQGTISGLQMMLQQQGEGTGSASWPALDEIVSLLQTVSSATTSTGHGAQAQSRAGLSESVSLANIFDRLPLSWYFFIAGGVFFAIVATGFMTSSTQLSARLAIMAATVGGISLLTAFFLGAVSVGMLLTYLYNNTSYFNAKIFILMLSSSLAFGHAMILAGLIAAQNLKDAPSSRSGKLTVALLLIIILILVGVTVYFVRLPEPESGEGDVFFKRSAVILAIATFGVDVFAWMIWLAASYFTGDRWLRVPEFFRPDSEDIEGQRLATYLDRHQLAAVRLALVTCSATLLVMLVVLVRVSQFDRSNHEFDSEFFPWLFGIMLFAFTMVLEGFEAGRYGGADIQTFDMRLPWPWAQRHVAKALKECSPKTQSTGLRAQLMGLVKGKAAKETDEAEEAKSGEEAEGGAGVCELSQRCIELIGCKYQYKLDKDPDVLRNALTDLVCPANRRTTQTGDQELEEDPAPAQRQFNKAAVQILAIDCSVEHSRKKSTYLRLIFFSAILIGRLVLVVLSLRKSGGHGFTTSEMYQPLTRRASRYTVPAAGVFIATIVFGGMNTLRLLRARPKFANLLGSHTAVPGALLLLSIILGSALPVLSALADKEDRISSDLPWIPRDGMDAAPWPYTLTIAVCIVLPSFVMLLNAIFSHAPYRDKAIHYLNPIQYDNAFSGEWNKIRDISAAPLQQHVNERKPRTCEERATVHRMLHRLPMYRMFWELGSVASGWGDNMPALDKQFDDDRLDIGVRPLAVPWFLNRGLDAQFAQPVSLRKDCLTLYDGNWAMKGFYDYAWVCHDWQAFREYMSDEELKTVYRQPETLSHTERYWCRSMELVTSQLYEFVVAPAEPHVTGEQTAKGVSRLQAVEHLARRYVTLPEMAEPPLDKIHEIMFTLNDLVDTEYTAKAFDPKCRFDFTGREDFIAKREEVDDWGSPASAQRDRIGATLGGVSLRFCTGPMLIQLILQVDSSPGSWLRESERFGVHIWMRFMVGGAMLLYITGLADSPEKAWKPVII